jgi:signal transduction histidine kinase
VDDIRPFIERRRQELDEQIAPTLCRLKLDAEKIRDCVNHLLLNAIKFTPDGGKITIVGACDADRDSAIIRVSDTGAGIDPANLPRIGEAFFTGYDVARHTSGQFEHGRQGLGLGLSVVKAFIAMHGGEFDVQSEMGAGTTVTLTLPQRR